MALTPAQPLHCRRTANAPYDRDSLWNCPLERRGSQAIEADGRTQKRKCVRLFLKARFVPIMLLAVGMNAMAQQSEGVGPEPLFRGLTWGMTVSTLRKTYARSDNLVEDVRGVWQDLDVHAHNLKAFVSFWVGRQGLHLARVSFSFATRERRVARQDVLSESRQIVDQLDGLYGKPRLESPWNGSFFSYVWLTPNTLVQFAWDGADNWAIHYRSRKLDPDAQALLPTDQEAGGSSPPGRIRLTRFSRRMSPRLSRIVLTR